MSDDGNHKDAAAVKFPPPLIPVIVILLGVGLKYVWALELGVELPTPGRYWAGGAIVVVSMSVLGAWPVLMFRSSGQSVIPWTETPKIIAQGPYRLTRNPMYLQMVLVCLGFAVILSNLWILILTPVCVLILNRSAIKPEEAYLEKKFGDSYLEYKKKARRWL